MRLLLVEDNERFAVLLKRGLAAAGFVVDVLPTAKTAAAALRASRFEIVVLDLGLPDADGLDVLGEMRHRFDTTPVLILTARGSLEDRVFGLQTVPRIISSNPLRSRNSSPACKHCCGDRAIFSVLR